MTVSHVSSIRANNSNRLMWITLARYHTRCNISVKLVEAAVIILIYIRNSSLEKLSILCMSHNKDLNSRMCDFKICTLKCYTVLHWHVLRTTTGKKSGSNKEACTY